MNYGIQDTSQIEALDALLKEDLIASGVECAMLIDTAGNTISKYSAEGIKYDTYAFAALAAGNYSAVESMSTLVQEKEFTHLYYKGEKNSIHLCKANDELLLVNIFNNNISLGLLRLKVSETIKKINSICGNTGSEQVVACSAKP